MEFAHATAVHLSVVMTDERSSMIILCVIVYVWKREEKRDWEKKEEHSVYV